MRVQGQPTMIRCKQAGLTFPIIKVHKSLKLGRYSKLTTPGSSVYLAAVLEYLVAEILELAGNAAKDNRRGRIVPRHLQLAIRNDGELNKLLDGVTIAEGGVLPYIHGALIKPKNGTTAEVSTKMARSKAVKGSCN